jgi:hypothetical protein
MKRFILITGIVIFLLSCDTDSMEGKEEDQRYYTVTYHSEGHTEGEVPVDTYKYPVNPLERDPSKPFGEEYERPEYGCAKIMDQGKMKKIVEGTEYKLYGWYWYPKNDLPSYDGRDERIYYEIGTSFPVSCNANLYADW